MIPRRHFIRKQITSTSYSAAMLAVQRPLTSILHFLFLSLLSFVVIFMTSAVAHASGSAAANRQASLVVNADTGVVLYQHNAAKPRYPASLTKMMTLYLTFEAMKQGKLKLNQKLIVSSTAALQPYNKIGLQKGQAISLKDCILSVIVKSSNTCAVVLAEAVEGSEARFADKMTHKARQLGMKHTIFKNASGLPNRAQKTTAYDLARLAIALKRDFPEYYPLFAATEFRFNGMVYTTHNRVTKNYPGADGLKTGYIDASGFNLVTSAQRNNTRLVAVVLGGESSQARDKRMVRLLDHYFTTPYAALDEKKQAYAAHKPIAKKNHHAMGDPFAVLNKPIKKVKTAHVGSKKRLAAKKAAVKRYALNHHS